MVGDVTPGNRHRIPLLQAANQKIDLFAGGKPGVGALDVLAGQGKKIVETALFDRQPAVHVTFADRHRRP